MQQDDLFSCPDPTAEVIARVYYHEIGESQFADERRLLEMSRLFCFADGRGIAGIYTIAGSENPGSSRGGGNDNDCLHTPQFVVGDAGALCPIRKMIPDPTFGI